MTKSEKASILSGLKEAMKPESAGSEDRVMTEVVSIDHHRAARVTEIKELQPETLVYDHFPEANLVRLLAGKLNSSHNSESRAAAAMLTDKLAEAARAGDNNRIMEIIAACKEYEKRFNGSAIDSVTGEIAACYIAEEIRKL